LLKSISVFQIKAVYDNKEKNIRSDLSMKFRAVLKSVKRFSEEVAR